MKNLKKLFFYIINYPVYLLSLIIKIFYAPSSTIWVFGAWFGEKYSDNSKYLFEYVNKNHPEIRAIWLSKKSDVIEMIRNKGYEAFFTYSLKGYFYSLRSQVAIVCTSMHDTNEYIPPKYIINLWHGCPLKKIGYDDTISNINMNSKSVNILNAVFKFRRSISDVDLAIASSNIEAHNLSTAFRIDIKKIAITGLPRNDALFDYKENNKEFRVIYMPTHRKEGESDIGKLIFDQIDIINNQLVKLGIILYLKLHYYHQNDSIVSLLNSYSNIRLIIDENIDQDIYSILNQFNILITDYSSVFFDFLLVDRPIIFFAPDYERYLSKDREMYYDYHTIAPGPICFTWDDVLDWLAKFKRNSGLYYDARNRIKNIFHEYQKGGYSKRVFESISKLVGFAKNDI